MRSLIPFLLFIIMSTNTLSQNRELPEKAYWMGKIKLGMQEIRVGFELNRKEGKPVLTTDSPDQEVYGMSADIEKWDGDSVVFFVPASNARFRGKIADDLSLKGRAKQGEIEYDLELKLSEKPKRKSRPQDPKPPYPYDIEEVSFMNEKEKITLKGTLTVPQGKKRFGAVVLVSGSGPQNRDSELLNHRPFHVIADYLTRRGIAVLRYDERGVGESEGDFSSALTTDFAADAASAVRFLQSHPRINPKNIGVIGHSEGGIVAPLVAEEIKDLRLAVLLGGPAEPGKKILADQQYAISKKSGLSGESLEETKVFQQKIISIAVSDKPEEERVKETVEALMSEQGMDEKTAKAQANVMNSAWMTFFLKNDPAESLKRLKCPTLALYGGLDLQVLAETNAPKMKKYLEEAPVKDFEVRVIEDMNHLFQECKIGTPIEYRILEETFSPKVLEIMGDWIDKRINR